MNPPLSDSHNKITLTASAANILNTAISQTRNLAETIIVSFTAVSMNNEALSAKNLLEDALYAELSLSQLNESPTFSGEITIDFSHLKSLSEPLHNALSFTEDCLENIQALLESSINADLESEGVVEGYMRAIIKDKVNDLAAIKDSISKAITLIDIQTQNDEQ